jgi:hypothetical protein
MPKSTKKVLIIWIEDDVNLTILNVDEEDYGLLLSFDNEFINSEETTDKMSEKIQKYFYDKDYTFKFTKKRKGILMKKTFDAVIMTGCLP